MSDHNHGATDGAVTVPGCPRCAELMPRDAEGFPLFNGARWSGRNGMAVPAVGTDIEVTMNGLGRGTVLAHQNVEGYLGLRVRLHNPPQWYVEQSERRPEEYKNGALVFGAEVAPIK